MPPLTSGLPRVVGIRPIIEIPMRHSTELGPTATHAIAAIFARGFLRRRLQATATAPPKPSQDSLSTCLAVSADTSVTVPTSKRPGERPENNVTEEHR
jgi:hypothetical protein